MRQHTKAGSCHSCSHGQSFTAAAGCVHSAAVANFMSAQQAQSASFIPQATATYLSKPYWDERFANEDSYEWCKSFDEFGHLLRPHFKPFSSLLEIGAGNSSLSTTLAKELPSALICSLDISQVVAERMREQQQASQGVRIEWQVGDMLSLPFCNDTLDVVLEKGALDVFLVDRGSPWDPAPAAAARMSTALLEIHRILRKGGKFISITFDQPHFRKPFLKAAGLNWDVQLQTFGDGLQYFVYVMTKGSRQQSAVPALPQQAPTHPMPTEYPVHDFMDQEDYLLQMDL